MNKIARWYNQNKQIFWIIVLSIIAIISLIQILNNYYKNNTKDESSSANISTTTYNTNNYSIVSQESIDKSVADEYSNLIDKFFNYCNNGNFEEAYNMLSSDCKNEVFPNINEFISYEKRIFTENKTYDSKLWITAKTRITYRLEITGDILASGEVDDMPVEEYYTIVKENDEYKINICKFVGTDYINVSKEQNRSKCRNSIKKKIHRL